MIQIIDASVAIKWFIAEEKGRKAALELLDEIGKKPQWFAVPEFFFNEMLSVLCRLLSRPELIQEHIEGLQNLGLSRLGNGAETLACAVQMAKKYRLSGYDAIYAANAYLTQGEWITADKRSHQKIESLHLSRLLS